MFLRACTTLALVALASTACGDDDGTSSGSGGGTSTSTGGSPTTTSTGGTNASSTNASNASSTSAVTGSTSTGGGAATCADLCAKATSLGCPMSPDCEGDCVAGYGNAGMCADELDAFLSCVADEATICADFQDAPAACESAADTLIQCTMN